MQRVLSVESLPESGIEASAAFYSDHLTKAVEALRDNDVSALAIVLPAALRNHDDWRRALARDLAREYAPRRVNVVSGTGDALAPTLAFLENARGITGQHFPLQE